MRPCLCHNDDRLKNSMARSAGRPIQMKEAIAHISAATRMRAKRPLTAMFKLVKKGSCQRYSPYEIVPTSTNCCQVGNEAQIRDANGRGACVLRITSPQPFALSPKSIVIR